MKKTQTILATVAAAAALNSTADAQSPTAAAGGNQAKNVVLVHGAFADGSGWRGVYDELTKRATARAQLATGSIPIPHGRRAGDGTR